MANNNNNWKRIGGFSRTGTQNYVRTNDAAMGGTTFGSTDVSNNVGNTTLRIGNNAGVVYINGDIDMSGGVNVVAPINRIRNVRDPIADQDVATKFYVDKTVDAVIMSSVDGVITGPTGREGPPGIGIPGTNGSGGPTGHTGCTGPLGATGSSFGVKGPTGEKGVPGSTGANGAAGATGPIGPIGEKGEQGTQGTQGIQGSNGTILWLNPDGNSPTNQLIIDSYLLSKVPINASIRTVGPISVSATYGNVNKIIPGSRFFNTAIEVSTLAVIPSGVWVLNLYANVPSNSDANQVALYAAVFMISGTTNQPSPDSLVIETKDGGDAGYYPPRAAYLPDHVKYIGKSWGSTDNVLISNTDTANKGVTIDGTSRKLYKLEMPVEFITLKDAAGNRENVYVQLQIYIRNTKDANQTANVSLYFQTDATTNETTYSYLQTTFGAVGIDGIPGSTGSTGSKGENGLIGPAGPAGATGSAGPTGIAGPVGPRGSQGSTGVTGPAGSSNSYGVQYAVQYRGNGSSTGYTDNSGNFRGDINFRYEPGPIGYVNRLTDASSGSVVLNDLACNSIHSPVYVQDTTISGPGTTRPRTYIRGGELVTTGPYVEQSDFVVLASGTDTTNGSNSKIAIGVNDITNGIKMVHNYQTKKVIFQVHDENKGTGKVGLQFDLNGSTVLGNVSAAQDRFCIVNSSGAVGVGGITAAQLSSSTYTDLNRMLHVRGNIMVGSDPGNANAASNAMVLLNKSTFTPSGLLSGYPGVYHRQIASGEVTALGGATNSIATSGEGLGFISPNFITFQTGSSLSSNSIVINQAGVVSVTGRTNLNGAVTVNKNFGTVETHDALAPVMDISGTLSVSTGATNFTDVPRIKLISRGIAADSSIPSVTSQSQPSTSNEIRGVSSNSSTSGFLRLSAQTPAHSCIDLIGLNTSASAYNNAVRISTGGNERMIVNGSGNVGIGTMTPTAPLDVNGITRIRNNLLANSKIFVGTTDTATNDGTEIGYDTTGLSIWNYRNGSMRFGTNSNERMRILGDGKVGIGTTNPDVSLHVKGDNTVKDITYIGETALYAFTSHLFSTPVSGRLGPTISQVRSTYSSAIWAQNDSYLTMNPSRQGIQLWTVPATGIYTITAQGASGSDGYSYGTPLAGYGKRIRITTTLIKGEQLQILVGQVSGDNNGYGGGGGGGSFVARGNTPIIVAGGGGGGDYGDGYGNWDKGSISTSGNSGGGGGGGAGGINGNGGNGGNSGSSGGGGFFTGGLGGSSTTRGASFIDGGAGGGVYPGGFGGGSGFPGGYGSGGPGGGGYSGGGGGDAYVTGGGGGSYGISTITDLGFGGNLVSGSVEFVFVSSSQNDTKKVCAIFENGFVAASDGYVLRSDQRIKMNIITNNPTDNLAVVRQLRTVKHKYIDKINYSSDYRYGFIAQEIQKVIPEAIIKRSDIIPSIYNKANIINTLDNKHILTFDEPLTNIDQFNGDIKLKCYNEQNEVIWIKIKEVIDEYNLEIEGEVHNKELFVYGHMVDDFLFIDKDTIWTIATAALQEVDRQQQADKARIAELENQVSNLEATAASQQTLINDILERLKSNGI